jgi:5-methylcytosine-specific restriction endonuclease McrA
MAFTFKEKTEAQLKANYYKRETNGLNGFNNFSDFLSWYNGIEEKKCHYCGVLEEEVQKIVVTGLLTSKRFPQNGNTGRGQARGMWLEVDKFNPNELYSIENCVLACYFCNNDKSDVFGGQEYLNFFQNRAIYLHDLLKTINL